MTVSNSARKRRPSKRRWVDAVDSSDIGDWTTPVPVTAVPTGGSVYNTIGQVGTRIYYIDWVSGNDGTWSAVGAGTCWSHLGSNSLPDFYLWNGTNIIDSTGRTAPAEGAHSGVAYGTDPFNPSVSVKPFKSWTFCGLRTFGAEVGSLVACNVNGRLRDKNGRNAKPDWWLFKRNVTHDLLQDFINANTAIAGTAITSTGQGLCLGESTTGQQVMGAWGTSTLPRPRITRPSTNGFFYKNIVVSGVTEEPNLRNCYLMNIRFDGHTRPNGVTAGFGINILGGNRSTGSTPYASTDIFLVEDVWMDGCYQSQVTPSNIWMRWRRCITIDNFTDSAHPTAGQGLFFSSIVGEDGVARLQMEECIFARNGFFADPSVTWPPTSDNDRARSIYLEGRIDEANTYFLNNIFLYAASGDQFRCGGRVEGNFFYTGQIVCNGFGVDYGSGASGTFHDNVLQLATSTLVYPAGGGAGAPLAGSKTGNPGWGFIFQAGAQNMTITRNIVTRAQIGGGTSTAPLALRPDGLNFNAQIDRGCYGNRITGNVFDGGTATHGYEYHEGQQYGSSYGPMPGVVGNTIDSNVFIQASGAIYWNNSYITGGNPESTWGFNKCGRYTGFRLPIKGGDNGTSLTALAVVGTPVAANWILTCLTASPLATFSVVGSNGNAGQPQPGTTAVATEGSAYNNGYWSCTNIVQAGTAGAYAIGDVLEFTVNKVFVDDTVIDANNKQFTSTANAATAMGYRAVTRTMRTRMAALSLGPVALDGYLDLVTLYKNNFQRGVWRTDIGQAKGFVNHIRDGFNMAALP